MQEDKDMQTGEATFDASSLFEGDATPGEVWRRLEAVLPPDCPRPVIAAVMLDVLERVNIVIADEDKPKHEAYLHRLRQEASGVQVLHADTPEELESTFQYVSGQRLMH